MRIKGDDDNVEERKECETKRRGERSRFSRKL